MIRNPKFGALLADKAFDVQWLIERLQAQGVPIVISQGPIGASFKAVIYLASAVIQSR